MITIILKYKSANEISDIVRELKGKGLILGKDFDFAYRPGIFNSLSGSELVPKHTEFIFYNEKLASLFALKYS